MIPLNQRLALTRLRTTGPRKAIDKLNRDYRKALTWWSQILKTYNLTQGMVGHLFQKYDTIYVRYFTTYTCNHSCYTIYVRFFATYTCVLSCFVGTNAHIYAHKKAHTYALQTSMWYMGSQKVVV